MAKAAELSLEKLKQIALAHPIHKGFYEDYNCINSFEELPITQKDKLLDLLATADPKVYRSAYISPSGATGGNSVYFPVSIDENHLYRKMFVAHLVREGILSSDEVYMNLFFHDNCYRSLEIFNEFAELAGATSVNVGTNTSNEEMLSVLKKFHCTSIFSSSRRLTDFALYLRMRGEQIQLNSIVFAAEPLQESKMNLLRQVFQTTKICGIYGSSESGVWAYQKPEFTGTNKYACHDDMVHLEVEELPNNEPGAGDIIITSKIRVSKMPTIRFRMGDQGRILERKHGMIVFELLGRVGKYFLFSDALVEMKAIEDIIPPEVLEWQIVLDIDKDNLVDILTLRVSGISVNIANLESTLNSVICQTSAIATESIKILVEECEMDSFILSSIGKIIRMKDKRK